MTGRPFSADVRRGDPSRPLVMGVVHTNSGLGAEGGAGRRPRHACRAPSRSRPRRPCSGNRHAKRPAPPPTRDIEVTGHQLHHAARTRLLRLLSPLIKPELMPTCLVRASDAPRRARRPARADAGPPRQAPHRPRRPDARPRAAARVGGTADSAPLPPSNARHARHAPRTARELLRARRPRSTPASPRSAACCPGRSHRGQPHALRAAGGPTWPRDPTRARSSARVCSPRCSRWAVSMGPAGIALQTLFIGGGDPPS